MPGELWKIVVSVALVAASFILYRRTFPPLSRPKRALLASLRIGAFVLLAVLLVNPLFVSRKVEVRKPLLLVLLDRSRSMGMRDSSGKTRLDDALDRIERFRGAIGADEADIEIVPFASELADGTIRADSAVDADGEGTDVWGALRAAETRYRARNLAAIFLLTDGRITRGMISSEGNVAAPVYAVGFGDTLSRADISIEDIIADRVAYRGTRVPIEAIVRALGFRGKTISVRLLDGGNVEDSATFSVKKDAETISASLGYVADVEGERTLTVEVLPAAGEDRDENNAESFRLEVLKEKIRILYIDQFADWNMTFIRDLVKSSRRLEAEAATWVAGRGFVLDPGGKPWTFSAGADGIERYDLVIVSDDERLFGRRADVEVLDAFVRAGGSVLFLADEHSPLARNGSFELLEPMLSVRRVSAPRIEYGETFVRLSAEGAGDPVAASLVEDGALDDMPPLPARIAGVAAASGSRMPLVLEDRGGRAPFLVLRRHGEGISAAILGFPLWRWKLAGEDGRRIYESFFGGLVQSLAESAFAPALIVETDRTVYRTGDRIKITAYAGAGRPPDGIRGEVRIKREGGEASVRTVLFEPDSRRPGSYRAVLDPLPPGDYALIASDAAGSGSGLTGTAAFSITEVSVELLDPSRNASLLARIAEETNGAYLEGSGLDSLAERLRFPEQRVERMSSRDVRGNVAVLLGIIMFLGAEWMLRKAWGLV